jgi:signal transduction histidine kinase
MRQGMRRVTAVCGASALLGIAGPQLARRLLFELRRKCEGAEVRVATTLTQLLEEFTESTSSVIFLDDHLVAGVQFAELLKQLTGSAHVVLLAAPERQGEVANFVAEGKLDFVARAGDFAAIAVSLIERQLRSAATQTPGSTRAVGDFSGDLAEIFRHEINNPLTGILGNAEMLLAHGAQLSGPDVQRLETVVELAVRLRETIRRVSDAVESNSRVIRSS